MGGSGPPKSGKDGGMETLEVAYMPGREWGGGMPEWIGCVLGSKPGIIGGGGGRPPEKLVPGGYIIPIPGGGMRPEGITPGGGPWRTIGGRA